jgi:hypothetical protein
LAIPAAKDDDLPVAYADERQEVSNNGADRIEDAAQPAAGFSFLDVAATTW